MIYTQINPNCCTYMFLKYTLCSISCYVVPLIYILPFWKGEPTIEEKANNFVDVLQLGGGATSPPISKVVVKANNVTVAPVIKGVAGRNRVSYV